LSERKDKLLIKVRELSLEGLIAKRAGSKYDSKRSGAWIKIKLYQRGFLGLREDKKASEVTREKAS
jgi:hypothetical protein